MLYDSVGRYRYFFTTDMILQTAFQGRILLLTVRQKKDNHRFKQLPNGIRQTDRLLRSCINAAAGIRGSVDINPVNMVARCFQRNFDMIGKIRAAEMSGEGRKQTPDTQQSGQSGTCRSPDKRDINERRRLLDTTENRGFRGIFSSYAFRGGKLAGAVLNGDARTVFITCIQRANGIPDASNEKRRRLLETSSEAKIAGKRASVTFNHDVYSAVGITVDAICGASEIFTVFRDLAEDGEELRNSSPVQRNINTIAALYPFLKTNGDKAVIAKYKSRLKALEGAQGSENIAERQRLTAALNKATAVLERKAAEQRKFLTIISTMQNRALEAKKLFTSKRFAETVIEEIKQAQSEVPPDDGNDKRRRRSLNIQEVDDEAGADSGNERALFAEADRTKETAAETQKQYRE